MNRIGRATILLVITTVMARLLYNGDFGWFVQQRMRWPLIAATVVLGIFGLYEAIDGSREEMKNPEASRVPAAPVVGFLLALPIMVLVAVAPTGLGSAAASRVDAYTPTESDGVWGPIDSSDGPVEMPLLEFLNRASFDTNRSLEGETIRLEGIVVNDPEIPDGFRLTRFLVSCCAADGIPIQVTIRDTEPFEDDTWVVADVMWRAPANGERSAPSQTEAEAVTVMPLPEPPNDAYESPY